MARPADDYYDARLNRRRPTPWYKKSSTWLIIAGVVVLLAVLIYFYKPIGGAGSAAANGTVNITLPQTNVMKIADYVIAQQSQGVRKEDIVTRLTLAGFTSDEIARGFNYADPSVQYIKLRTSQNASKEVIIDELAKRGLTNDQILTAYTTYDSESKVSVGLGPWLAKNWWVLLIIAGAVYFFSRAAAAERKAPKIYTLEECRLYAEEKLKEKNLDHNPCKEYRNRPEIRQYRYVYEEPYYPEVNDHRPSGFRQRNRRFYLIAVGYDKELVDFRISESDAEVYPFLYGPPKSYEARSGIDYLRMRQGSEQKLPSPEEIRKRQAEQAYGPLYNQNYRENRRYPNRFRPGGIEGYEEQ